MRGNPLPMIAGALSYQVTGWFRDARIFDSLNSEAMLFTFLAMGLGITGWLAWKQDDYSSVNSWAGRAYWIALVVIGAGLGIFLRLQTST